MLVRIARRRLSGTLDDVIGGAKEWTTPGTAFADVKDQVSGTKPLEAAKMAGLIAVPILAVLLLTKSTKGRR